MLIITSLFICVKTFKHFTGRETNRRKLSFREMVGPASISLGAKIGTGSIIGVLGSLNKMAASGQGFIEGIALWGLLGAAILIPLTYSETFIARTLDQSPMEYIKRNLSARASAFYAMALVVLYIFGFGGFQFNGIDTVTTIAFGNIFGTVLTESQRYFFVVIPIILIAGGIILTKKHTLFINALSGMIGFAVLSYFIFFFVFLGKTAFHIPEYLTRAWSGFTNPVTMGIGIPAGLIFGLQRIIQTSEAGLGTSPLASEEGKEAGARNAALTQVIPTAITVAVSLLITSYITSYGLSRGIIVLPADGIGRLTAFFTTAESVTGLFGMAIISIFAILSGITTLLGSYFFLSQLFHKNSENKNIAIYISLIITAGTLAVFGFDIVFDVVDILLFAVSGLNVAALAMFVRKIKEKKHIRSLA